MFDLYCEEYLAYRPSARVSWNAYCWPAIGQRSGATSPWPSSWGSESCQAF